MMKMNNLKLVIAGFLVVALLCSFVSAFGVSYTWGSPLRLTPGESKEIYITLQNRAGEIGDVNARVDLLEGGEIAELIDSSSVYLVPYGGDARVNFTVSIPESAMPGQGYWIKLSVTTVSGEESGGMGFAMGSGEKIYVEVYSKDEEEVEIAQESSGFLWLVLLFILLAIVIIAVVLTVIIKKRTKN